MQENTNRAIILNSIILYARLIVTTLCSLLTVRFALKALGVADYGLYSMVASTISLIAIINTIMAGTTRRFIAVAIGKSDINEANKQFNVNQLIQSVVAVVFLLVAVIVGRWYVFNYVNYDGSLTTAFYVYCISIVGSAISFAGVAYHGLLTAKENFLVFSIVDVISQICKLLVSFLLIYCFHDKLLIYAFAMSVFTATPVAYYAWYCYRHYYPIAQFRLVREKKMYYDVLAFAKWNSYGAVAWVAKEQGTGMLINLFFNTLVNAALGIANTINGFITMFSQNLTNPISPQITKSYASGDYARSLSLLTVCTKLSYLVMYLISVPFLVGTEYILKIWLGEVPMYAVLFTQLLIIERLIDSLNNGIAEIVFADGNISFYQISTNTIRLLSIVAGFVFLYTGYPPYSLLYCYIIATVLIVLFKHVSLARISNIDTKCIYRDSYIPSVAVTLLTLPVFFYRVFEYPLWDICVKELYVVVVIFMIGLRGDERRKILVTLKRK